MDAIGTAARAGIGPRRWAYAAAGAALLGAVVAVLTRDPGAWGWALAGALGPDLALLGGMGRGVAPGRLHPRAVPAYNAVHRAWGPLALTAAAVLLSLGPGALAGGLAWAAHVAFDRAAGYALRTRDGRIRGAA